MKDHKKLSKEFFDMQASIYDEVEEAGGNARSVYPAIIKLMDEHGYDSALDVGCSACGFSDRFRETDRHCRSDHDHRILVISPRGHDSPLGHICIEPPHFLIEICRYGNNNDLRAGIGFALISRYIDARSVLLQISLYLLVFQGRYPSADHPDFFRIQIKKSDLVFLRKQTRQREADVSASCYRDSAGSK